MALGENGENFFWDTCTFLIFENFGWRPKYGNVRPKYGKRRPIRTRPKGKYFFPKNHLFLGFGPVRPDPSDRTRPTVPVRPIPEMWYTCWWNFDLNICLLTLGQDWRELVSDGSC